MTERERIALAEEIASAMPDGGPRPSCACSETEALSPKNSDWGELAALIDYSLNGHRACKSELQDFLAFASSQGFRSVCVPPRWTATAVRSLWDKPTRVASLIGLPDGASLTPAKCAEAECLLRLGVDELWMVADTGGLRSGDLDAVFIDIQAVASLAQHYRRKLNVTIEFGMLDQQQRLSACVVAKLAGATGAAAWMADDSASGEADLALMRKAVGGDLDVLAIVGSAGASDAHRIFSAGATRIMVRHDPTQ